jgi:glycerophosphoryl diester phosphodiesterase
MDHGLTESGAIDFDLQGHRGARGLAPENTLPAFSEALALGVSTLELDTAVTSDGVVVVAHDRRLNPEITRGPDGAWLARPTPAVHHLSYAQLQRFDVGRIDPASPYATRFPRQRPVDGVRMPRLADVFALARTSGVRFNIETKLSPLAPEETPSPERFVDALVQVIDEAQMSGRVTIQSFDWRTLIVVQRTAPQLEVSYLTSPDYGYENDDCAWTAGFRLEAHGSLPTMIRAVAGGRDATWSPDYRTLTANALREAQAEGLHVLPWTVNDPIVMARLIDWGVSGFITDYPDIAREVMQTKAMKLLPPPWRAER